MTSPGDPAAREHFERASARTLDVLLLIQARDHNRNMSGTAPVVAAGYLVR